MPSPRRSGSHVQLGNLHERTSLDDPGRLPDGARDQSYNESANDTPIALGDGARQLNSMGRAYPAGKILQRHKSHPNL